MTRTWRVWVAVALCTALMALGGTYASQAAVAASKPSATPTAAPTQTATPAPTQTARVIVVEATQVPTLTPAPTSTPMPTGPLADTGGGAGPGFSFGGLLGLALHWWDLFSSIGDAVVGWVATGITDIIHGVAGLVTAEPRPDQWGTFAGFLAFLQQVAVGWAGAFFVFGVVLYVRSLLTGKIEGGLFAMAVMTRAIETAILVPSGVWIIGQILTLGQDVADLITDHSGAVGLAQLLRIADTLLNVGPNPVNIIVGLIGVLVFLLVILMKFASAAVLAWLCCVGVLSMGTWMMGSKIVARWFWNFVAVALWGAGWALWFKIIAAVLSDYAVANPLSPFLVLALVLMGYGIPRLVDDTLGTSVAGYGTGLAGFVVGIGAGIASQGAGRVAGDMWGRFIRPHL